MILGMVFGFKVVLLVAGVCYLGSLMVITKHSGGAHRSRREFVESVASQVSEEESLQRYGQAAI